DAAEEFLLVVGQHRLRVIVLGAGPGIAHLGHVVLPGQAFREALGVEGDLQLGHRSLLCWCSTSGAMCSLLYNRSRGTSRRRKDAWAEAGALSASNAALPRCSAQ